MFLKVNDTLCWRRASGGYGYSKLEDRESHNGKMRVTHMHTTSRTAMYIDPEQVLFVCCPVCGKMSIESSRLVELENLDGSIDRFCSAEDCDYEERVR